MPSVPQQEGQTNAIVGKVIADYELDVDYEPEGSDPDAQEEEKNSDA